MTHILLASVFLTAVRTAPLIAASLERAELKRDGINVVLTLAALIPAASGDADNSQLHISRLFPMTLQRCGLELKLVIPATGATSKPHTEPTLIKALVRSRHRLLALHLERAK